MVWDPSPGGFVSGSKINALCWGGWTWWPNQFPSQNSIWPRTTLGAEGDDRPQKRHDRLILSAGAVALGGPNLSHANMSADCLVGKFMRTGRMLEATSGGQINCNRRIRHSHSNIPSDHRTQKFVKIAIARTVMGYGKRTKSAE